MSESSKFTMLGMSNSGKTCYIAGMYSELSTGVDGFTLLAEDETRIKLEDEIYNLDDTSLKKEERFPQPTLQTIEALNAKTYNFGMYYDTKKIISFEIADYSGGSLRRMDEVREKINNSIAESTVLYIFIDGELFHAETMEKREKRVQRRCAMTICPMIQDCAKAHSGMLPPIVFVVTKSDICMKYAPPSEIISVIKKLFQPAFSQGTSTYICAVTLGKNISDDEYRGEFEPHNMHIPFFIGCYHEYYNRWLILQHDIDTKNAKLSGEKTEIQQYVDKQYRKWKIFRDEKFIDRCRNEMKRYESNIRSNQQLLASAKEMLMRFGICLELEYKGKPDPKKGPGFFYFKDGRQMDFKNFQV